MTYPFRDNGEWLLFVPTAVKLLATSQSKMCLKPWELINKSLLSWIRLLLSRTYFLSSPQPKGKAEISSMFVLLSCLPFLLLVKIYIWHSVGSPRPFAINSASSHFHTFQPIISSFLIHFHFFSFLAFPFLLPSEPSWNSNGNLWVDKRFLKRVSEGKKRLPKGTAFKDCLI